MYHPEGLLEQLSKFELAINLEFQKKEFEKFDLLCKATFKAEEKEYKNCGFPDSDLHKQVHDEFVRTLASFQHETFNKKSRDPQDSIPAIIEYVRLWIEDHKSMDGFAQSFIRIQEFCS